MTDNKTRPYSDNKVDASSKTQAYEDEAGLADKTVGYESKETKLTG